ncbi:MAG TPA: NifX-associated nitrogen fixation protein [Gammaproteobacteria bacterium]|nr:NifX-associated nitrogen fixation protein [Gammaproteobacteria bacterium]
MTDETVLIDENDPVLESDFVKEMVRQMRAVDTYGTYDNWTAAKILEPFILTREMKREIPIIGDPDEIIISRIKAFYNAIAAMIEKECGLMASPVINITYEGFGRVIIIVGKLVVLDKNLRDVHRFGFQDLSKMKDEADKILSIALEIIGKHSDAAGM